MIFEKIQALLTQNIDFVSDTLEAAFEQCFKAGGEAQQAALRIEAVQGSTDVGSALLGVFGLAETFGAVYAALSVGQRETIVASVAQLVSFTENPALEKAIEDLFDSLIRSIAAAKGLNELVDSLPSGE